MMNPIQRINEILRDYTARKVNHPQVNRGKNRIRIVKCLDSAR